MAAGYAAQLKATRGKNGSLCLYICGKINLVKTVPLNYIVVLKKYIFEIETLK